MFDTCERVRKGGNLYAYMKLMVVSTLQWSGGKRRICPNDGIFFGEVSKTTYIYSEVFFFVHIDVGQIRAPVYGATENCHFLHGTVVIRNHVVGNCHGGYRLPFCFGVGGAYFIFFVR